LRLFYGNGRGGGCGLALVLRQLARCNPQKSSSYNINKSKMGKYESLIGFAGILGLISFSSLIQQIYQTHNTSSLPWTWITMNLLAQSLSLIYGISNMSYGIMLPGILFLSGLFYILYVKLNHKRYDAIVNKEQA
jgi:hypothetical protein